MRFSRLQNWYKLLPSLLHWHFKAVFQCNCVMTLNVSSQMLWSHRKFCFWLFSNQYIVLCRGLASTQIHVNFQWTLSDIGKILTPRRAAINFPCLPRFVLKVSFSLSFSHDFGSIKLLAYSWVFFLDYGRNMQPKRRKIRLNFTARDLSDEKKHRLCATPSMDILSVDSVFMIVLSIEILYCKVAKSKESFSMSSSLS